MLQALVRTARRVWEDVSRAWRRQPPASVPAPVVTPESNLAYRPLDRIVLTDGVCRTLFEEYAAHRDSPRGDEETGWVLLGLREEREALALATLPAGTQCEAGVAHVRFNSSAQALASRIVRQHDRQLAMLGVVHTHPGSLRHPSRGDYQGDRDWVGVLRGREGVFGIGTADGEDAPNLHIAHQPKKHSQCYLGLRMSWYVLGAGERDYRPLPLRITLGPDLARPLHELWPTIEAHAERLDNLCRRLSRIRFEVLPGDKGPTLHLIVPTGADDNLRVVLQEKKVEYVLERKGQWLVADLPEPFVDRGVYLLLAELAGK